MYIKADGAAAVPILKKNSSILFIVYCVSCVKLVTTNKPLRMAMFKFIIVIAVMLEQKLASADGKHACIMHNMDVITDKPTKY